MIIKRSALSLCIATFLGCASTSGVHPDSLKKVGYSYFYFPNDIAAYSYDIRNAFGKVMPSPGPLCAGKYEAWRRDETGVFYTWPTDCPVSQEGGIWVPDNPQVYGYQTWLANIKPDNLPEKAGVLIEWETGRIRKSGITIESQEVIELIKIEK